MSSDDNFWFLFDKEEIFPSAVDFSKSAMSWPVPQSVPCMHVKSRQIRNPCEHPRQTKHGSAILCSLKRAFSYQKSELWGEFLHTQRSNSQFCEMGCFTLQVRPRAGTKVIDHIVLCMNYFCIQTRLLENGLDSNLFLCGIESAQSSRSIPLELLVYIPLQRNPRQSPRLHLFLTRVQFGTETR